jgi:hypothetical protein
MKWPNCFVLGLALVGLARGADDPTDLDLRAQLQPAPLTAQFSELDYYVWCGSMVRDDTGKCHLFYSRWPHKLGFEAWVTHSEIAHAVSDNPLGPYHPVDVALPPRGKEFWDGLCTHDPTVMRFGSKYYLYYMGNTAEQPLGDSPNFPEMKERRWVQRNNQRVGVAVADSPNGPWQRMDHPLIAPTPGFYDALCCTDPTVTSRPGGGYVMVYKGVGDKRPLPFGGPVVLLAATSDSPTGPFTKQPEPVFRKEGVPFAAEDPFIWSDGHRCWAVIKDQGGYYTEQGGKGRSLVLFESPDGLAWQLAKHPFITTPEVTWTDGRHEKLAQLERPQVWLDNGQPAVLFGASDRTPNRNASFNLQIPLRKPGE